MGCLSLEASQNEILDIFFKAIAASKVNLTKATLSNFYNTDLKELMKFVSAYDSKWVPTKDNDNNNMCLFKVRKSGTAICISHQYSEHELQTITFLVKHCKQ